MRGNTGDAPLKVLDEKGLAAGGKRFRFLPLSKRLEQTSARPAALPSIDFSANLTEVASDDTSFSHFKVTLLTEADANITTTFKNYYREVHKLSLSLPLLYRNRKKVFEETITALEACTRSGSDATTSIARCLSALSRDLGPARFYPFFPDVVKAIANVFALDHEMQHPTKLPARHHSGQSILWDPQASIVPLFASLAEITKTHLKQLTSDPAKTVSDLLPLLSNHNRRVREMTAEACFGYLLRKTRESGPLKELVTALVRGASFGTSPVLHEEDLIDGLGASLFESLRIPNGRLQVRAANVVRNAVECLGITEDRDEDNHNIDDTCLSVLTRCFANVARHVKNEEDSRTIFTVLIAEGQASIASGNPKRASNILYVLRHWLRSVSRSFRKTLGSEGLDLLSTFLSDAFVGFHGDSRVVYESFSSLLIMALHDLTEGDQEAHRKIVCVLQIASMKFQRDGLLAVLQALLLTPNVDLKKLKESLPMTALSAVIERLAQRCQQSDVEIPLCVSALLFRRLREDGVDNPPFSDFAAPTLRTFVKDILSNAQKANHSEIQNCKMCRVATIRSHAIDLLCNIRIPGLTNVFNNLLDAGASWTSASSFPQFLTAMSVNVVEEEDHARNNGRKTSDLLKRVRALVVEALMSDSVLSASLLDAISVYIRTFPSTLKDSLLDNPENMKVLFSKLSKGLSSPETRVRLACASLLSTLCSAMSSSVKLRSPVLVIGVEDAVAGLRVAFESNSTGGLQGLYEAFVLLLSVPSSLQDISGNEKVLREVVRLTLKHSVNDQVEESLLHFSIGVLRTPLRVLWDISGDLWRALAKGNCTHAMDVAYAYLMECGSRLLATINGRQSDFVYQDGSLAETQLQSGEDMHYHKSANQDAGDDSKRKRKTVLKLSSSGAKKPLASCESDKTGSPGGVFTCPDVKWKRVDSSETIFERFVPQSVQEPTHQEEVDAITGFVQLLKGLSVEPRYTLKYRARLITSYLQFDPISQDGKGLSQVLCSFTALLECMGGLKCCEQDLELEHRMRKRLLSILTKTHIPLQTAVIRCICASRSPALKPHRDSFVRLLSEKSFREELAVLTESLCTDYDCSADLTSICDEDKQVCEILTRIAFSKMRGKQSKLESKRSAVLSFLVAKLPWQLSMPMLVSLALAPIEAQMSGAKLDETCKNQRSLLCTSLPSSSIQRGILFSVEAVIKYCKRAIPLDSWRRLGVGTLLLLQNSSSGSVGQGVRSRALNVVADMHRVRASDSRFLVKHILCAIQDSDFALVEYTGITGVPALMHYVDAVMSSGSENCCPSVLNEHTWSLRYCLQVMKNESAGVSAVSTSLSVGIGFAKNAAELQGSMEEREMLNWASVTELLEFTCISLRDFLSWVAPFVTGSRGARKTWTPVLVKALGLTSMLANNKSLGFTSLCPLADGLCSFIETGTGNAESLGNLLRALESIVLSRTTRASESRPEEMEIFERLIVRLMPLLNNHHVVDDRDSITSLCGIISRSTSQDTSTAGGILHGLNAFDTSRLNELDYDKRIESLKTINDSLRTALGISEKREGEKTRGILLQSMDEENGMRLSYKCGVNAFLALFYGCLAAIRCDDTAVRGTAGYSLSLLARWAGQSDEAASNTSRTRIFKLLVSEVGGCKSLLVRREYCKALGQLVRNSACMASDAHESDTSGWNSRDMHFAMTGLANATDLDADFFENLVHLQPHRRGRALRQLEKHLNDFAQRSPEAIDEGKPVPLLAFRFALPLGLNIALEKPWNTEHEKKQTSARHTESREGAQKDVSNWAVDLVGTSCAFLSWREYKAFLSSILRRIKTEEDRESVRLLDKLLVSASKAFPTSHDFRYPGLDESTSFLVNKVIPEMLKHVNASAIEGELLGTEHQILRDARKSGKDRPGVTFRSPIAVAVAELMTCLPGEYLDSHISLLMAPLSGALRSRASEPREEAKKALAALVVMLGPKYFSYILGQVLNALKEGYRKDACVYVIYTALNGVREFCKKSSEPGSQRRSFCIDGACCLLADYLCQELESGLGESKRDFVDPNVSADRERQASRRAVKVYECLEVLSEHIGFRDSAPLLCTPFLALQSKKSSTKLLNKTRLALQHVIQGFSRNESMLVEDGLKLCYSYVTRNGKVKEDTADNERNYGLLETSLTEHDEIETVNFGLQLLSAVISRNIDVMKGSGERARLLQSMSEPFLPLTMAALNSGDDDLMLIAFRVCQKLLRLPLSSRAVVANKLSEKIIDVLASGAGGVSSSGSASGGEDLFNTCLRAGAVLLHEVGSKGFTVVSRERVEALVNISCNCLEHGSLDARSAGMALLRAVVTRRIIMPCVYDAMEKLKEMAIHSQSTALRKSCISVCVAFLVSFPLGSKRVRQHVEFFVRNLNYKSANGRLAAVQALDTIITKFPGEALEEEKEYIFLALTAAGARDTDAECRNAVMECLKHLFQKLSGGRQTKELVDVATKLTGVRCRMRSLDDEIEVCGENDEGVRRAGMVGLTAAGLSGEMRQVELMMITRVAVMILREGGRDCGWETKYVVLKCIEGCIKSQSEDEMDRIETEEKMWWLWEEMEKLLIDKHQWVRMSGCRLVGEHLSAAGGRDAETDKTKVGKGVIWGNNVVVRKTMKALCLQLEATHVEMELGEQALKNLLCMASVLQRDSEAGDIGGGDNGGADNDGADMDIDNADAGKKKMGRGLRWLVGRMSGMAVRGGVEAGDLLRRACGLRFLIVSGTWWGKWVMDEVGRLYIKAAVYVLESGELQDVGRDVGGDEGGGNGGEAVTEANVVGLGQKLEKCIREHMDEEEFYSGYRKIHGARDAVKKKRKREEAVRAVVDGEAHARKRRAKAEVRREKKRGRGGGQQHRRKNMRLTDEM